jgi:hypothetical protein
MPLVFFTIPNNPRMLATLDAIRTPLSQGGLAAGGLVSGTTRARRPTGCRGRLDVQFLAGRALARAGRTDGRRLEEARLLFEEILGYANHLGLGRGADGRPWRGAGQLPQAFTHLTLASAANLDRTLGWRGS